MVDDPKTTPRRRTIDEREFACLKRLASGSEPFVVISNWELAILCGSHAVVLERARRSKERASKVQTS